MSEAPRQRRRNAALALPGVGGAQPDAALETSFANAAQISVSYCEPWANREAPLKALKWMFDKEAPLLFRPQMDWQQWRWGLQFLAQCNDTAFERNVQQIVALGADSHAALKDLVGTTGIEYNRLERGIAHFYTMEIDYKFNLGVRPYAYLPFPLAAIGLGYMVYLEYCPMSSGTW